jgi:symplekin
MDTALDQELDRTSTAGSGGGDPVGGVGAGLGNLQLIDFKLPPPKEFTEEDRAMLIRESVGRIWNGADELKFTDQSSAGSGADMWMLLVVRLVTRVAEPPPSEEEQAELQKEEEGGIVDANFYSHQDRMRQTLCDYVVQDFQSRCAPITPTVLVADVAGYGSLLLG